MSFVDEIREKVDISTCSPTVQKGIKWLENEMKSANVIQKVRERLSEVKRKKDKYSIEVWKEEINRRLAAKYLCDDVVEFYALSLANSHLVSEFVDAASHKLFWKEARAFILGEGRAYEIWFLVKLGLKDNPSFKKELNSKKSEQTVEGRFFNTDDHVGILKALVLLEPHSDTTKKAVESLIKKILEKGIIEASLGVLALSELDHEKYHDEISRGITFLKRKQDKKGSWGSQVTKWRNYANTSWAIQAISRINGNVDQSVQKALMWFKKHQHRNGSWGDYKNGKYHPDTIDTAFALMGLMSAGEGPKVSLQIIEPEMIKLGKIHEVSKPHFVHTSPLFKTQSSREIHDKVIDMMRSAKNNLRICSLYIDMLYEELIDLKSKKKDLTIRVLTRPIQDLERGRDLSRKRICKATLDLLPKAGIKIVTSSEIHSRIIITDDQEVLVSSADLTRDQLFDEYNAGIWTKNKETVQKAIDFFENIWELECQKRR